MKKLTQEEKEQLQAMVNRHEAGTEDHTIEHYAGFWMRLVASFIDGVIVSVVAYGIRALLPMSSILAMVFGWLYFALVTTLPDKSGSFSGNA